MSTFGTVIAFNFLFIYGFLCEHLAVIHEVFISQTLGFYIDAVTCEGGEPPCKDNQAWAGRFLPSSTPWIIVLHQDVNRRMVVEILSCPVKFLESHVLSQKRKERKGRKNTIHAGDWKTTYQVNEKNMLCFIVFLFFEKWDRLGGRNSKNSSFHNREYWLGGAVTKKKKKVNVWASGSTWLRVCLGSLSAVSCRVLSLSHPSHVATDVWRVSARRVRGIVNRSSRIAPSLDGSIAGHLIDFSCTNFLLTKSKYTPMIQTKLCTPLMTKVER
jgi:hypothetical protein